MMARTQITLEPELQKRARKRAAQLGISLAEYIRRLMRRDLGERKRQTAIDAVFDLGASGESDIARDKDAQLGAAVGSENKLRRRTS